MAIVSDRDKEWLASSHPELLPRSSGLCGTIRIKSAFDEETNQFFPASADAPAGALELEGTFRISIADRDDRSISALPALKVDGVEPIANRHFSQRDFTACLCSPFEEKDFLSPEFNLRPYVEQLVIPFLYGQLYFSRRNAWPWRELPHGATGILESYAQCDIKPSTDECLRQLKLDVAWIRIEAALKQKPHIKGHTPCFCAKKDLIRRCHPLALHGLRLLRDALDNEATKG